MVPNLPHGFVMSIKSDNTCKRLGVVFDTYLTLEMLYYISVQCHELQDELPLNWVRIQIKSINMHYLLFGITVAEHTYSSVDTQFVHH